MSEQGNKNGDNTTAAWGPLKTNLMSAMNSNTRVTSFVLFSVLLVVITLPAQQLPQENKPLTDRELELLAVRGKWAMYSRDTGATPPDPPPPNASYKDAAKLKPFQTIPRVQIFLTEGRLFGEAVFPDGIVLTDENADVTGKEPVPVQGIQVQDGNLSLKVQVGSELIEARLKLDRRRFLGTWRSSSGRSGDLFMVKRIF